MHLGNRWCGFHDAALAHMLGAVSRLDAPLEVGARLLDPLIRPAFAKNLDHC
jgi:hypothetical protein